MLPKRVGEPKMIPSYCASSSTFAMGAFWSSLKPLARDFLGHRLGNAADVDLRAGFAHAFRHGLRHSLDVAVGGVIQNQYLCHRLLLFV
jgi:hypothetical protein